MWLGTNAATRKITENSISPTVMCRMNAGGDQISNPPMRAVLPVAPYDQHKTDERDQRKQSPIGWQAELRDRTRARLTERYEDMRSEKDQQGREREFLSPCYNSHSTVAAVEDSRSQCKPP